MRAAIACSTSMSRTTIGPLVTMPTGVSASRQASRAAARQGVAAFDRLIRIGGGAERRLLARPRRFGQLAAQHGHEVGLDEDDRGEVVALAELELVLVAPGEAVVTAVGAAAVWVQRPAERHALDAVQRRAAVDLLIGGMVGALHGIRQRRDASGLDQRGDVASRRPRVAEVEQRRGSGLGHDDRTISLFVRLVKRGAAPRQFTPCRSAPLLASSRARRRGSGRDPTPASSRCRR